MRKTLTTLLAVCLLLLGAATTAGADQPAVGTMTLSWNSCWAEPGEVTPDWVGSFSIDGHTYGMAFFNLGSGKPFEDRATGLAGFFTEVYALYPAPIGDCPGDTVALTNALLWGHDTGMVNLANSHYQMSGDIDVASGPLAYLAGGQVFMSGIILWSELGAPVSAPGEARFMNPHRDEVSHQHQAL
jgi:hypothetical protein